VVERKTPELDKRCHELTLVTLSADMCQTDHQVVMKKALDDYIPIYSAKIEVNSQPIDHFELLVTDIILQNSG